MRFLLIACCLLAAAHAKEVWFRNERDEDIEVFWVAPSGEKTSVGTVKAYGGELFQDTFVGHKFAYGKHGEKVIREDRDVYSITHADGAVRVECRVTGGKYKGGDGGELRLTVYPDWSPRGAGRFLELVRRKYFDGAAVNRVVPKFLAQFGISADYGERTEWRSKTIKDDTPQNIPFKPGYVAFAGAGPDSRSTEMFLVMPDTPQSQLSYFGKNPWETPFAVADEASVRDVLPRLENPYGDMPPWGGGPDPQKIYKRNGYEYLAREFPKLAYYD
eukprot:CAMPEP_0119276540 /NCGR_PEP_ID=MMETSP1329-20130426/15608_1 /TAXON_ID=114041 /ORGANISM="Genus nov. species nov., Strain RCC1024" /LENGTH=273 /DNA_ID=CAMNT_0007276973 /DNA_START=110 /DNA_END=928 /DNA_ORIENTATION=-